jgi:hypothetical protein
MHQLFTRFLDARESEDAVGMLVPDEKEITNLKNNCGKNFTVNIDLSLTKPTDRRDVRRAICISTKSVPFHGTTPDSNASHASHELHRVEKEFRCKTQLSTRK